MNLKARLGDIDSGIHNCVLGGHSFNRVLTHPYIYELTGLAAALATVRAWSTGRARLRLGYGLANGRPRVARAHARRRHPLAQRCRPDSLACARKTNDQTERAGQARKQILSVGGIASSRRPRRSSVRCPTPARCARLRGTAHGGAFPETSAQEQRYEERVSQNHFRPTYKGCEQRATLGNLGHRSPSTSKRLRRLLVFLIPHVALIPLNVVLAEQCPQFILKVNGTTPSELRRTRGPYPG